MHSSLEYMPLENWLSNTQWWVQCTQGAPLATTSKPVASAATQRPCHRVTEISQSRTASLSQITFCAMMVKQQTMSRSKELMCKTHRCLNVVSFEITHLEDKSGSVARQAGPTRWFKQLKHMPCLIIRYPSWTRFDTYPHAFHTRAQQLVVERRRGSHNNLRGTTSRSILASFEAPWMIPTGYIPYFHWNPNPTLPISDIKLYRFKHFPQKTVKRLLNHGF